ncbi:MAG: ATP phosphoribosyltransferase regulatory subunit [Pseudomonadales bacterium]|nr:ATP phosphoribosyltransferase regulatory subunit [Pseudomonadales bacterium]
MTIRELEEGGRWLLPDGVEEILPPQARRIEQLRRRLLDLFDLWGYELVLPPLLEYLESLLVGVGGDLDLQTFKVTDQLTGRMMGIRADITSQVARIDAHVLGRPGPSRLCYAGTVLRTRPEGLFGSRTPIRIGAELYGVPGPEGDAEVLALMTETLARAGVASTQVELGHTAIFRSLARSLDLAPELERQVFEAVQRKAGADLDALLDGLAAGAARRTAEMVRALPALFGGAEVLVRAREVLAGAPAAVAAALDELDAIHARIQRRVPGLEMGFDLSELHGYHYHSGAVFSAYASEHGRAVARGGRYDDIGHLFGRARPATGFDADLKVLAELAGETPASCELIQAPDDERLAPPQVQTLWERVAALREAGHRVVVGNAEDATHRLAWRGDGWVAEPLAGAATGKHRADGDS